MSQMSALAGMLGGGGSPIGGAGQLKAGAGTPSTIDPNAAATAAYNAAQASGGMQMTPAQLAIAQHQYELNNPVRGQRLERSGGQGGPGGGLSIPNVGPGDIMNSPLFPDDMGRRLGQLGRVLGGGR